MNKERLQKNLEALGYTFRSFATVKEAADYLDSAIDGKTVGMGGSVTLKEMGIYDRLSAHNTVHWHWDVGMDPEVLNKAAGAQVYLTSANGVAETGEIINIDGTGNRISATAYGKEAVYYVIGTNKVAEDYDKALWRARNIASPLNARRLGVNTPCAKGEELKCYNCKSPQRICRGLSVLWQPLKGVGKTEIILIDAPIGY